MLTIRPRFAGSIVAPGTPFRNAATSTVEGAITAQRGVIYNGNIYRGSRTLQYFDPAALKFQLSPVTPYIGTGNSNGDGNGSSSQTFWLKKWTDPVTDITLIHDWTSRTSWLDMRLGEVLLTYAEASFELGRDPSEALGAINKLRDRAGMPALLSIDRAAIRHERMVELAFENVRYFDTRRWKIAEQTDAGPFYGMNINAGTSLSDPAFYKRTAFENRIFQKRHYFWPIPQKELDVDKQLVQNTGW